MITTSILVNIFSETIKQTIFYVFNLLNDMSKKADTDFHDIEIQHDIEETIQPDSNLNYNYGEVDCKYFLRERKAINYKI